MEKIIFFMIALLFGFIIGWIIADIILLTKTSGELYLVDDTMYLNISKEDVIKFKNNHYISLKVKRRNFSGFNDDK